MKHLEGKLLPENESKVMKLLKCLYGLKESPRQFIICIDTVLKQLGFTRRKSDFGICVKGEWENMVYTALSCHLTSCHVPTCVSFGKTIIVMMCTSRVRIALYLFI